MRLQGPGVRRPCRDLTREQRAAFEAEGRRPVVRFRMPDGSVTFDDLVRGEITFETPVRAGLRAVPRQRSAALHAGEPHRRRADGDHPRAARRGPALQTPRQIALYEAFADIGIGEEVPQFGHLPFVMGEGNSKLSKRDPESNLLDYAEGLPARGPAELPGPARLVDRRRPRRLHARGDGRGLRHQDVNPNPARFDLKKAEAINAAHMRLLGIEDLEHRLVPFLQEADLIDDPPTQAETLKITEGCVLIHERVGTLAEAADMLAFLFLDDVVYDEADVAKVLDADGLEVVAAAREALERRGRVDHRRDRGGAAHLAGRRARAQAARGVRAGAGRRHRAPRSRRRSSSRSSCWDARRRWLVSGPPQAADPGQPHGPPGLARVGDAPACGRSSSSARAVEQAAHPHPEPRTYPLMLRTWSYRLVEAVVGLVSRSIAFFVVQIALLGVPRHRRPRRGWPQAARPARQRRRPARPR